MTLLGAIRCRAAAGNPSPHDVMILADTIEAMLGGVPPSSKCFCQRCNATRFLYVESVTSPLRAVKEPDTMQERKP